MDIEGVGMHRPDLYYIDTILDRRQCLHREEVVPAWRFWWTYLTSPWRWRRWRRVLREKDGFS